MQLKWISVVHSRHIPVITREQSTTNIKVMDDYSTQAFIQSFVRFSCEVGYPKFMPIDEGSQLVKGCEIMRLNFMDIRGQLNRDMMVEFDMCAV